MVTSAMISFVSGKQIVRLFTVLWLNTWYKQANMSFWISGWGTQGRCRYSAVSLITRFDFMAPVTRVITALQCNFPFETNGKLIILGVPVLKHIKVCFHLITS